ncbi:MAG: hypothetical protein GX034_04490 [Clostridiaceae bacterium]|jgi:hypothetical protein|nr:hypothetical protein [Clostridiaceae bacterium]
MRRKGSIKELISQLIILVIFAVFLYLINSELTGRPELSSINWLRNIFYIGLAIFAILFLLFFYQVFSNHALERYDPGSPESLRRLSKLRRFMLPRKYQHLQERWPEALNEIKSFFVGKNYNLGNSEHFDFIFERERSIASPWRGRHYFKRSFVCYHPMLNVLIVDQKLKQAERWIDHFWETAASEQNFLIFLTDMENFDEISSAGAGVVNFLGTMKYGSLYPVLIDLDGARFFFPVDVTMLKRRDRLYYYYYRRQIKKLVIGAGKRSVVSPDNGTEAVYAPNKKKIEKAEKNKLT